SSSWNYPTTAGAWQTHKNSGTSETDAILSKINPDGTALVYSTYFGASYMDDWARGIAVDGAGHAFVTGGTGVPGFAGMPDYPTTPGAFQPTRGGGWDAFVTEFETDGSGLVYSSFLGGTGIDNGRAITLDADGNAYVTGTVERATDDPAPT